MTLAAALRLADSVLLVADRMITSGDPVREPFSMFGEKHISTPWSVQEGGLKLQKVRGDACFTFAGRVDVANRVWDSLQQSAFVIRSMKDALVRAIDLVGQPADFQAIVGYYQDGPRILAFNAKLGSCEFTEPEDYVIIGSLPTTVRSTHEFAIKSVHRLAQGHIPGDEGALVTLLGALQASGIHYPLVDDYIGGTFFGCRITRAGFIWQPSIKHVIHRGLKVDGAHVVQVHAFEEGIVVIPTGTDFLPATRVPHFVRVSARPDADLSNDPALQRAADFVDEVAYGPTDWLVLYSLELPNIVIFEMKGARSHKDLKLEVVEDGAAKVHMLYLSGEIANWIQGLRHPQAPRTPLDIAFLPFAPPSQGR